MVRGANPGGGRDILHAYRTTPRSTHPPVRWVPGLFPGVKRPGLALTTHPHLALRLKQEKSYTFIPSMACYREN